MGSYSSGFDYRKTTKSVVLISLLVSLLSLPSLPFQTVASGLSVTVGTNKAQYVPGETVTISGYVRMDGNPVPTATVNVSIHGPDDALVWSDDDITDISGFYSLSAALASDASAGQYNVTATTSRLDPYGSPIVATASVTFQVVAPAAEEVKIGVYGPGDAPIENASVILYDHITGGWVKDALTNASGIAVMTVYTAVSFDVLIYKAGYGTIQAGETLGYLFDNNAGSGYASPCFENFTLSSVGHGSLSGVVSDGTSGAALESATVSILAYIRGRTYWVYSATTSSDGSYSADLNVGLWKVWIDKKTVGGALTHLGTWSDVQMTADALVTLNLSLWPKAILSILGLRADGIPLSQSEVMLINNTYGGILWRREVSSSDLPLNVTIPAIRCLLVVTSKSGGGGGGKAGGESRYFYSASIDASDGGTVTLNATLYDAQYEIWTFPSDSENDRLLGNLTMETFVVTPHTGGPGGPPQFTDPDGSTYEYLMFDCGAGIPTTWNNASVPVRTEAGSYYQFFDLNALSAPQGYYISLVLVTNSTGHVVGGNYVWFNMFQYQVQPLLFKSAYDVGEDVHVRFKVYGTSGYITNTQVVYRLFDGNWNFLRGGPATANSSTRVWNITLPSAIFSQEAYRLTIKVAGGRGHTIEFRVQEYTPVTFSGHISPYASIDLWSEQIGPSVVTADGTGLFNVTLLSGTYGAWFHYDNKSTPGWDARDTFMSLSLTSNITDFPTGFFDYQQRPMQPAFELRGVTFNDANRNGIWDSGEGRIASVNVRAQNMTGWEEWGPPTNPDGSYRLFLPTDTIYRLKATKSIYLQNDTATPEAGAGTVQGDLVITNIPMVRMTPGNITGYVKLDNGTLLANAGLHFMDEYWSWLGSTSTNSTGGYLFTAPGNRRMNMWVDPGPGVSGVSGKDFRDVMVGENEVLYLNITLQRSVTIAGRVQLNGIDTWTGIMPFDENWNRLSWEWSLGGQFQANVPASTKKLLFWSWGSGFLTKDVELQPDVINDLGTFNLTAVSPALSLNVHSKNWAYEWLAGQKVEFIAELRNTTMWDPIQGATLTFWAWHWDSGTLVRQDTVLETAAPGVYEANFTVTGNGPHKVLVLANASADVPQIAFSDFWFSVTDKKLFLIEGRGEYSLSAVQGGTAKVRVKLVGTTDGNPVPNYPVWFEIRKFTNVTMWQMENAIARTRATDLGQGVYEVTIPATLGNGSYWIEIMAGNWETSQRLGFTIASEPASTVNIYGWVTMSPTPVEGAIVETWMEGKPYLYITSTNASGYFSLPLPAKKVYHLHIYYDNATTPGVDYTTIPEWNRIEVKVVNIPYNATVSRIAEVTLTVLRNGQPTQVDVLVWDTATNPGRLIMWSGTWRGPGLFNEKIKEGTYTFEVGIFWPPAGPWHYWWESPSISAETGLKAEILVPTYDIVATTQINTQGTWRVEPGDSVTMRIWKRDLMINPPGADVNLTDLLENCEKRLEAFHWVPGRMADGFAYNDTSWTLKQHPTDGAYLEMNFTIPQYFGGGDYDIYAFFYNASGSQKLFVKAQTHLLIAEIEMGLTVVPYSASPNSTVIAAVLLMAHGVPAQGADVAFEIYDGRWQSVDVITGTEVSPGIYITTFAVPEGYEFGWWTVKATATVQGKETVSYQGFNVMGD